MLAIDFGSLLTLGNPDSIQKIVAVYTDARGNFYVAGTFEGTVDFDPGPAARRIHDNGDQDVFIAKYNASGALRWVKRIGGEENNEISDMAVDGRGNVYITGPLGGTVDLNPGSGRKVVESLGEDDVYVAKLSASGKFAWGGSVGGRFNDEPIGIDVTPDGQVYMGGHFLLKADLDPTARTRMVRANSTGASSGLQLTSRTGRVRGLRTIDGEADESWYVRLSAMAVSDDGQVALGGRFGGRIDFDPTAARAVRYGEDEQAYLLTLGATGRLNWIDTYGAGGRIRIDDLGFDPAGSILTAGQFTDEPDFNPSPAVDRVQSLSDGRGDEEGDLFVQKFSSSGQSTWVRMIGDRDAAFQVGGLAVNASGEVYVTGGFIGRADFDPSAGTKIIYNRSNEEADLPIRALDGANAFVLSFSSAGVFGGVRRIGNDDSQVIGTDIAIAPGGDIFVGGLFAGTVDFDPSAGRTARTAEDDGEVFVVKFRP